MTKIQLRHDTAANFASENPILLVGEAAIETDTNKIKIGDGTTAYNSLEYFGGEAPDLSAYYNKTEVDGLLDEKVSKEDVKAPIVYSEITQTNSDVNVSGDTYTLTLPSGITYTSRGYVEYNNGYRFNYPCNAGANTLSQDQLSYISDNLVGKTIYHGNGDPAANGYGYPNIVLGKLSNDRTFTPKIWIGGFTSSSPSSKCTGRMFLLPDTAASSSYSAPRQTKAYSSVSEVTLMSTEQYCGPNIQVRANISNVSGTIHVYGYFTYYGTTYSGDLNTGIAVGDFDLNCALLTYTGQSSSVYQLANTKVVDNTTSQTIWQAGDSCSIGGLGLNIGPGLTVVNGALTAPGDAPSNMMTTDTDQTVSGTKTFSRSQVFSDGLQTANIKNQTGTSVCLYVNASNLKDNSTNGLLDKDNKPYLKSTTGVSSTDIRTIAKLTQAQYDALATKDSTTLYFLTDTGRIYFGDTLISKPGGNTLLDFKWTDHQLNDVSFLRADTFSWQDGTVYANVYSHLVNDIDGITATTETIGSYTLTVYRTTDGHKICLADQEQTVLDIYNTYGIAWYYILDTTNTRFKLPRTKFGFEGFRTNVGDMIAESLPNITGYAARAVSDQAAGGGAMSISGGAQGFEAGQYPWRDINFDASASSSTYQNNAPVQERATQMYLYFYVGNYSQTAVEQTAGLNASLFNNKADVDLSNMNDGGKIVMAGMSMPSNTYIDLTLGASGDTYTAPANGRFLVSCMTTDANFAYIAMDILIGTQWVEIGSPASGGGRRAVYGDFRKGQQIRIRYSSNINVAGGVFKFIYAQGSESEAS